MSAFFELSDQRVDVGHDGASLPHRGVLHGDHLDARRQVHAQLLSGDLLEWLLFGFLKSIAFITS